MVADEKAIFLSDTKRVVRTEQSTFSARTRWIGGRGWLIILCVQGRKSFAFSLALEGKIFQDLVRSHTQQQQRQQNFNLFSNTKFSDIGHNFLHINRAFSTRKIIRRKNSSSCLLSFGCLSNFRIFIRTSIPHLARSAATRTALEKHIAEWNVHLWFMTRKVMIPIVKRMWKWLFLEWLKVEENS